MRLLDFSRRTAFLSRPRPVWRSNFSRTPLCTCQDPTDMLRICRPRRLSRKMVLPSPNKSVFSKSATPRTLDGKSTILWRYVSTIGDYSYYSWLIIFIVIIITSVCMWSELYDGNTKLQHPFEEGRNYWQTFSPNLSEDLNQGSPTHEMEPRSTLSLFETRHWAFYFFQYKLYLPDNLFYLLLLYYVCKYFFLFFYQLHSHENI